MEERVRAVLERVRVKGDMDKRAGVVQQLGTFKGTYSELKETQRTKRDTLPRAIGKRAGVVRNQLRVHVAMYVRCPVMSSCFYMFQFNIYTCACV